METRAGCVILFAAYQHDHHVHQNSEGSAKGVRHECGHYRFRRRGLLLERDGDERKEIIERRERNEQVHTGRAGQVAGHAPGDSEHAARRPRSGNHRPHRTGRGADHQWPAGAEYREGWNVPAFYGAVAAWRAYYCRDWTEPPGRNEQTASFRRGTEVDDCTNRLRRIAKRNGWPSGIQAAA